MPTAPTLTSTEIRRQFIDFFVEKAGHTEVPSSPVVPHDDPTLLFTNAGMNQFKDVFLGIDAGGGPRGYTRAVDTQKCIRAGGKHNDLDDVGKDTYHHTFFEMLGNWSFGDYFKKEAIAWAWELLVDRWGVDPERLYATYFEGDAGDGLEPDHEARDFWLRFLPPERVQPGNKKDNFWEMGETGPCGPCSELHYDRSPDKSGGALVNADAQDTVVEIWNLVFIQFNRNQDGSLSPLPARHVDTGMGFERIVRVLQGKDSNYDTDVFAPLFQAIEHVTRARPYRPGADEESLKDPVNIAYRVIADHIRTLVFALGDGAHCGNEGRSYVLRSILRRAVRFGKQTLGVDEPFFYKLVPAVVDHFGDTFPEIGAKQEEIAKELREEEEGFRRTLDRGIGLFEQVASGLAGNAQRPAFPGEDAFKLHDTYGFPIGLTRLMAEERGLALDLEGFERAMERAREISRGGGSGGVDAKALLTEWVQQNAPEPTPFVGDTATQSDATILHVIEWPGDAGGAGGAAVVLDRTPFYAEQGGQVGDQGKLTADGLVFQVTDTQKIGETYFHIGSVESGKIVAGASVAAAVEPARRGSVTANHTATHIMNRALRDHVSPDANQKGSRVDDEKTRFDFSHHAALTLEQLQAVEGQVNDDIAADLPVYADDAPQEAALKINGLRAVFGEKYPPQVRVVSIGAPVQDLLADPGDDRWAGLSIEFCGGTHLGKTGDAEGFVIVGEEGVAKGIRRVTAMTGRRAHEAQAAGEALLARVKAVQGGDDTGQLTAVVAEVTEAMKAQTLPAVAKAQLRDALKAIQSTLKQLDKAKAKASAGAVVDTARRLAEGAVGPVIATDLGECPGGAIRSAMDVFCKKHPDAAVLLAGVSDGKVSLMATVPPPLIGKGLKAGDWIKHVAPVVGGGGGGRPDAAQAGGKDPSKVEDALAQARSFAAETLS